MTIEEELKGCLLVLSHLDDDMMDRNVSVQNFLEHPPFKGMHDYLQSKGYDMISFTNYINKKYKIQSEPLWEYTAKEFYATTKSRIFYKRIIRNLKLELLCQN
jgi:hypothetical protein